VADCDELYPEPLPPTRGPAVCIAGERCLPAHSVRPNAARSGAIPALPVGHVRLAHTGGTGNSNRHDANRREQPSGHVRASERAPLVRRARRERHCRSGYRGVCRRRARTRSRRRRRLTYARVPRTRLCYGALSLPQQRLWQCLSCTSRRRAWARVHASLACDGRVRAPCADAHAASL
jgi:hypothetical protein